MLSASAASDSEDAALSSELAAAGSEALAASSASTAVAAKDVAVSSAQAASADAGTASSARTDAINAKDAAEAAQAECEAIEEGLQTASTHSHSNKPFLDELNEKTIAGYNVIRSQNLPPVGEFQQGTFCVVDAVLPKKVYLNIGLAWIEIQAGTPEYGQITAYDDVTLLWRYEDGSQLSAIGPDPDWSYADVQYDEDGVIVGDGITPVPAIHGDKGVWCGPSYTNMFTEGAPAEQTKTLTEQKYTVWCDTGSVICGVFGTATAENPLTFTATAGDCTFTPTDVTKWMLTATAFPMPYVLPGTTVASAAGTSGNNGIYFDMAEEPDGVELVYNGGFDEGVEGYSVVHPTVTAVDGKAVFTDTPASTNGLEQVFSTITGARYRASCTISTTVGGIGLGISSVQDVIYAFEESKIITFDFTAISSSTTLIVRANGAPLMTGWVDNISVQRLSSPLMQCFEKANGESATCTAAAEVTMGVGSGDLTVSNLPILSFADSFYYNKLYIGDTTTRQIVRANDGPNNTAFTGTGWNRNERHIKIVQTNADGTQFRVGNKRIGIDEAIQWSSWTSFDGSFNPLTALRLAYGTTVPIWFRRVMVSNKGGMSDAEILTRMEA
jgi:hypothetical protein